MAQSKEYIKAAYPLPAYNYRVTILGNPGGANNAVVISAAKVSGLVMEQKHITYKHGFSFLMGMDILPGMPEEVRISIEKGVVQNGAYLSEWMKLCYPVVQASPMSLDRKRDILIDLCDENGVPVVRWTVSRAMPIKLAAPSFDAGSNEVAIEQLDLVAHELKVDYTP